MSHEPRIFAGDHAGLVAFIKDVFGAEGEEVGDRPVELRLGDSMLMVSGIEQRAPASAVLYIYVPDTDATYAKAIAAGSDSMELPMDTPYGDRRAMVRDPWGNTWQIATRME